MCFFRKSRDIVSHFCFGVRGTSGLPLGLALMIFEYWVRREVTRVWISRTAINQYSTNHFFYDNFTDFTKQCIVPQITLQTDITLTPNPKLLEKERICSQVGEC